jgi:NAD(P)-dependent dehydrogenase (short-subunit alcohol dehydrogenase family)
MTHPIDPPPRVVITGGLGALGRVLGAQLAAQGARVALLDRVDPAAAQPVPGVAAVIGPVDLGDEAAAAAAFDHAAATLGGISALVNVAGGFSWQAFEGGDAETWDQMYALNLRTAVVASMATLPHLLREAASNPGGAAIVNVGAAAAAKAGQGMGAYAASKAGVAKLTEAMADEFKLRGLRVNAVLPSIIDTPANRAAMPDADVSSWVTPLQLARVVAFLISGDAAAVTGACLPVTGRV